MDWWKIYDKIVIPTIVILFIVFFIAFFWPKNIIVTCVDGTVIELNETVEDWESYCNDYNELPPFLPGEPLNLSALRGARYPI